jgi:hypothetical protein
VIVGKAGKFFSPEEAEDYIATGPAFCARSAAELKAR